MTVGWQGSKHQVKVGALLWARPEPGGGRKGPPHSFDVGQSTLWACGHTSTDFSSSSATVFHSILNGHPPDVR